MQNQPGLDAYGQSQTNQPGPGMQPQPGFGGVNQGPLNTNPTYGQQAGAGGDGTGMQPQPQQGFVGTPNTNPTYGQPISTTGGTGIGQSTGTMRSGTLGHSGSHGATQGVLAGKLEHAAGVLLSSETLKARGIEKEREANAMKVQAAELGRAEQLEAAALAHRSSAVSHGAHPSHGQRPGT